MIIRCRLAKFKAFSMTCGEYRPFTRHVEGTVAEVPANTDPSCLALSCFSYEKSFNPTRCEEASLAGIGFWRRDNSHKTGVSKKQDS